MRLIGAVAGLCVIAGVTVTVAQTPKPKRINRAIELLEQGQPIYYTGSHSGTAGTFEQGKLDAQTFADYISYDMEAAPYDIAGLAAYMQGLVAGGPTRTGHRTPPVIVNVPIRGTDEASVRANAWMFEQVLATGVHGILLVHAQTPGAVRALVEAVRYPNREQGVGQAGLKEGTRGAHGAAMAAKVWGVSQAEYMQKADPWPLNPNGELLLGVKLESPEGIANCEAICAVPGLGFAEMGPGDLGLSLGYTTLQRDPYPPEMAEARASVFAACRRNHIAFLEGCTPANIVARLDEGVRVIAGHHAETARIGRAHQKRSMPM